MYINIFYCNLKSFFLHQFPCLNFLINFHVIDFLILSLLQLLQFFLQGHFPLLDLLQFFLQILFTQNLCKIHMILQRLRIIDHHLQFLIIQIVSHFKLFKFLSGLYWELFHFCHLLAQILIRKTLRFSLQIIIVFIYVMQCLFYYLVIDLRFYVEFHLLQKGPDFLIENLLEKSLIVLQFVQICVFWFDLLLQCRLAF